MTLRAFKWSSHQALLLPVAMLATVTFLWIAKSVLVPMLFAILLAQLLCPLVNRFERYLPPLLAVFLSMGVLTGAVVATMSLIVSQLSMLQSNGPAMIARISNTLEDFLSALHSHLGLTTSQDSFRLSDNLAPYVGTGGSAAFSAVTLTIDFLVQAALVAVLSFLMLYLRHHFRRYIKILGQKHGAGAVGVVLDRIAELGQNYVAGLGMVILIVGVADTVGLLLVGSPFPALFGLIGALSVLLPYLGFAIAAPFCAMVAWLLTGSVSLLGGIFLVFAIVHFLEGNVISPFLVGSKVNLNPLTTILAVLVGGQLWGPAGMVLFIPLVGLISLGLDSIPGAEPVAKLLGPVSAEDLQGRWVRRRRRARWRHTALADERADFSPPAG